MLLGVWLWLAAEGALPPSQPTPSQEEPWVKILRAQFPQPLVITQIDPLEPSPLSGILQRRVWIKVPQGEQPFLVYLTEDGKYLILGSILDMSGVNLTQQATGKIKPLEIPEETMVLDKDFSMGSPDAPIRIVFWGDVDCPYCKRALQNLHQIIDQNPGKIILYYKFLPLPIHPQAKNKAEVASCFTGEAFFDAVRKLEVTQGNTKEDYKKSLNVVGDCREDRVERDMKIAQALGFNSTPTIFVNGKILDLRKGVTAQNIGEIAGVPLNAPVDTSSNQPR